MSEKFYDVIIVGAGILGCFAARAMSAYNLSCLVLEKGEDVCTEMSKSNSGIIYPGYDHNQDNMKTILGIRGNQRFESLCQELDVPYRKCGLLMVGYGPRGNEEVSKKFKKGKKNRVEGIRSLTSEEAEAMEPNLKKGIQSAMYAPGTYTVNPWALGIAAFENAQKNGVHFQFLEKVEGIKRLQAPLEGKEENPSGPSFQVCTDKAAYHAGAVINCAGSFAEEIREHVEAPLFEIRPTGGTYFVMDEHTGDFVHHIVNIKGEEKGKDLIMIPTVDGNLLVGPNSDEVCDPESFPTGESGQAELRETCANLVPGLDLSQIIRSFGTVKPKSFPLEWVDGAYVAGEKNYSDFITLDENGLISLVAIRKPGLTCAEELGKYVAERAISYLGGAEKKPDFNPYRKAGPRMEAMNEEERTQFIADHPDYGHIVCRCRKISKGEILDAIRSGAKTIDDINHSFGEYAGDDIKQKNVTATIDGIKRRTGAGMGRCQGGYCMQQVMELIAKEEGLAAYEVNKTGPGTGLVKETNSSAETINKTNLNAETINKTNLCAETINKTNPNAETINKTNPNAGLVKEQEDML